MIVHFAVPIGVETLQRFVAAAAEHETDVATHAARACRAAAAVWLSRRTGSVVRPAATSAQAPTATLTLSLSSSIVSVFFGIAASRGNSLESVIRGVLDAAVEGYPLPSVPPPSSLRGPKPLALRARTPFDPKVYARSKAIEPTLRAKPPAGLTAALMGDPGARSALAMRRASPAKSAPVENFPDLFAEDP